MEQEQGQNRTAEQTKRGHEKCNITLEDRTSTQNFALLKLHPLFTGRHFKADTDDGSISSGIPTAVQVFTYVQIHKDQEFNDTLLRLHRLDLALKRACSCSTPTCLEVFLYLQRFSQRIYHI